MNFTNYVIREGFLGGVETPISPEKYEKLLSARNLIIALDAIEELFNLIANSYVEFEKYNLLKAIDDLLLNNSAAHTELSWAEMYSEQNLKILTLLNAVRAYLNQTPQRLTPVREQVPDIRGAFKSIISSAFDRSLEYRIMDAFRNYSQHAALPIQGNQINNQNQYMNGPPSSDLPSRLKVTVNPYFSAKSLLKDSNVRQATRDEISAKGIDKLDVKYFVRSYVSEICNCHQGLRKLTESSFDSSLSELRSASELLLTNSKKDNVRHIEMYHYGPEG